MNFKSILKSRFSIGKKIAAGYIVVILLAMANGIYAIVTLRQSRVIDSEISQVHMPFLKALEKLENSISNTRKLSRSWIYSPNDEDKNELKLIHENEVEPLLNQVRVLNSSWREPIYRDSLELVLSSFEENLLLQKQLMNALQSALDYESIDVIFPMIEMFDEQIVPELTVISQNVRAVKDQLQIGADELVEKKYASFDSLEMVLIWLNAFAVLIGIVASFLTTTSIVGPIRKLTQMIQRLGLGELPDFKIKKAQDEVGDMIISLQNLRDGLSGTSDFASELGKGNLAANYVLLSDSDVLGKSLIMMRDKLKDVIFETNQVIGKAEHNGDLAARINVDNKTGAWSDLANSINTLLASVAMPILRVNEIVNAMAEGDLTQRYTTEAKGDIQSLAESLNSALDSLNNLLHQISTNASMVDESAVEMLTSSEEMNGSTGEIATSIGEMSNGAQTQVTKVDESSILVEGILNSSNEMGERAKNINEGVDNVVTSSKSGMKMLDQVVANMADLSDYSVKTTDSMKILTTRSSEITRVLNVITEIASQTNLLALNAAIEAAQAGDAGRGFAVVAEEIRKLAEDSKSSAREIENLIQDVQKDTQEASKVTEAMSQGVKIGETASKDAAEMFKKIAEKAGHNLTLSEAIVTATEAQQKDIRLVVSNTENIVVIAEETAAGTEEIASSASELSSGMESYTQKSLRLTKIAEELKAGVSKFKLKAQEKKEDIMNMIFDNQNPRINPN
ncbi:MAG: methyl-accepting chemotaxis protein [Reichenbachiella sp.]|uniref:methyl-accepting chemotaxis protein n=1 Tax=Reichenbachiella sp. TaxID=2184521 RepID=UPI0032646805